MSLLSKKSFFFTAGFIWILCAIGFVLQVWNKISTGHGLDYYKTRWGVEFSYTGAFVLILLIPILCLIPVIYDYLQQRAEKDLAKKYRKN